MDPPTTTETILQAAREHDTTPIDVTRQARAVQGVAEQYLEAIVAMGWDPNTEPSILSFTPTTLYIEGTALWPTVADLADIPDPTAIQAAHEATLPTREYQSTDAPLGVTLPTQWQAAGQAHDAALMALISSEAGTASALDYYFVRHRGWSKSEFATATGRSPQAVSNNVGNAARQLDDERWPTVDRADWG